MGETIQNRESTKNNVKNIEWVKQTTAKELNDLKEELGMMGRALRGVGEKRNFFEEENGKIKYNLNLVRAFLDWSVKYPDKAVKLNKTGVLKTFALQIALEANGYDVGKIDGIRWRATVAQLRKFQQDNKLKIDGKAGPETMKALSKSLEGKGAWFHLN